MKRALWDGNISFGLINIPVTLHSAEQATHLQFHLLDKKNHGRIRYERVNEVTGKKVAWQDIVKAYEYEKGTYVVIDQDEVNKLLPQNGHAIDIENFVAQSQLDLRYYERPYYLIPGKFGTKGYVLLRETLKRTHKVAIAKIMLRTRQYLAALIPHENALLLEILRFPEELVKLDNASLPEEGIKAAKLTPKEIAMAEKLIASMSAKWNPKKYPDQNRDIILNWIEKKIKGKKTVSPKHVKVTSRGNVVDFMELLKKSIKNPKSKSGKLAKDRKSNPTSKKDKPSKSISSIPKSTARPKRSPKAIATRRTGHSNRQFRVGQLSRKPLQK